MSRFLESCRILVFAIRGGSIGVGAEPVIFFRGDAFIDRVLGQEQAKPRFKLTLDRIVREACLQYSVKEKDLRGSGRDRRLSEARGMAAWLVLELGTCTLGELGKRTGRDITTLSSAAKRLQMRAKRNLKLAEKMRKILESVS